MTYIVGLILGIILLLYGLRDKYKKKRFSKRNLRDIDNNLSKNKILRKIVLFIDRKSKNKFKKNIVHRLHLLGISLSVEAFIVISMMAPFIYIGLRMVLHKLTVMFLMANQNNIKKIAEEFQNKGFETLPIQNMKIVCIQSVVTIIVPFIMISILNVYKKEGIKKEVSSLQSLVLVSIKAKINVKEILLTLYNNSRIYKKYLGHAVTTYSINPNETLNELKSNIQNTELEKIIIALRLIQTKDRDTALNYLENGIKTSRQKEKHKNRKKNKNKIMIGTVCLMAPMISFLRVGGCVWFYLALKYISNISSVYN